MMFAIRTLVLIASFALTLPSTEAATRIATNKDCYEEGESISVTFQTDAPSLHDWVSILPPDATLDPFSAHVTVEWAYTCGSQTCNRSALRGTGNFNIATTLVPAGSWKVVLVTLGTGVWVGAAESSTFEVQPSGQCTPSVEGSAPPTKPPTNFPTRSPVATGISTNAPTVSKSDLDTIKTNKNSYEEGESILISFENTNPRIDDWVGIYASSVPSTQLRSGEMWMYLCGGQQACTSEVSKLPIYFLT